MLSTVFTDNGSTYTSNAALKGGVFLLDKSTATLSSITVSTSYALNGAVFTVNDVSPLTVTSSTFTGNTATTNAGIAHFTMPTVPSTTTTYSITFTSCTFTTNSAGLKGGAFYVDSSQVSALTLSSVTMSGTTAGGSGGVFYIADILGTVTINSASTIQSFSAVTLGSLLYSADTDFALTLKDSTF